jgi:hypothetical protein
MIPLYQNHIYYSSLFEGRLQKKKKKLNQYQSAPIGARRTNRSVD